MELSASDRTPVYDQSPKIQLVIENDIMQGQHSANN